MFLYVQCGFGLIINLIIKAFQIGQFLSKSTYFNKKSIIANLSKVCLLFI